MRASRGILIPTTHKANKDVLNGKPEGSIDPSFLCLDLIRLGLAGSSRSLTWLPGAYGAGRCDPGLKIILLFLHYGIDAEGLLLIILIALSTPYVLLPPIQRSF